MAKQNMAKETQNSKISLIVEKSGDDLWGRITVNGNLIVDSASTQEALKKKLVKAAKDFEGVDIDSFEISHDLTSFFEQYSYLSISDIAEKAGINPGLMRQYAAGVKFPSEERVRHIQDAIREIGKELSKVRLHKTQLA
jgi:hypothetical protein